MDKGELKTGQTYYYLATPSLVLSNISEWDGYVPEIEEYVYVARLSQGRDDDTNWFALKDTRLRYLLRDIDIQRNLFATRPEAEEFQKEYIQRAIDEIGKHIERINATRDMFIKRQTDFDDIGPLFSSITRNNDDA